MADSVFESVLLLSAYVQIVNLGDKEEFNDDELTKQLLSKVIDRIVVIDEKTATVHFKSGLIMEKTLSPGFPVYLTRNPF